MEKRRVDPCESPADRSWKYPACRRCSRSCPSHHRRRDSECGIGGEIAGRIAAEAVSKGDFEHLKNYETEWRETLWGTSFLWGIKREFLEENWNKSEIGFEDLIRKTWVGFKEYYKEEERTKKGEQHGSAKEVSPQYVQTSLAASLTLGFQSGSFHRNAKLKGLNLLLHYEEGCSGRCHFCGLSRSRQEGPKGKTFIRVDWPLYPLEEIIERSKEKDQIHRVCISMITHPKALEDTLYVIQRFKEETDLFISVLITPTLIPTENPGSDEKGRSGSGGHCHRCCHS